MSPVAAPHGGGAPEHEGRAELLDLWMVLLRSVRTLNPTAMLRIHNLKASR